MLSTTLSRPRSLRRRRRRAVELRLGRRQADSTYTVPSCATSCILAAVTKSTTCKPGDHACECETSNAVLIYEGSNVCIDDSCGIQVAAGQSFPDLSSFRRRTLALPVTLRPDILSNLKIVCEDATAVAGQVSATAPGGAETSTAIAGGSFVGSQGSSSGSSGSPPGSSSSSSLSTGTIVGIAVGSAGGAVLLCGLMFLIYRCTRHNSRSAAQPAIMAAMAAPPLPHGAVMPAKPELDGKLAVSTTTVSTMGGADGLARYPSKVSVPSPGPYGRAAPMPPPPMYAGQPEAPSQAWAYQQHPQQIPIAAPRPVVYEAAPGQNRAEMSAAEAARRQELDGRGFNGGMYEM